MRPTSLARVCGLHRHRRRRLCTTAALAQLGANRFGGTIGGPVVRNRWFYFGNFEYAPVGLASTSAGAAFVPTAEGYRALDAIPGLSKRNLDAFRQFVPAANAATRSIRVSGRDVPVGILSAVGPAYQNNYNAIASSDYNVSDRDQVRARYLFTRANQIETGVQLPAFYSPVRYSERILRSTCMC